MSDLYGIDMVRVDSSNVESVGFDEAEGNVVVRFLSGAVYIYKGVSQVEFEGLKNAPSVGSYLHNNFKGVYPYERIA